MHFTPRCSVSHWILQNPLYGIRKDPPRSGSTIVLRTNVYCQRVPGDEEGVEETKDCRQYGRSHGGGYIFMSYYVTFYPIIIMIMVLVVSSTLICCNIIIANIFIITIINMTRWIRKNQTRTRKFMWSSQNRSPSSASRYLEIKKGWLWWIMTIVISWKSHCWVATKKKFLKMVCNNRSPTTN